MQKKKLTIREIAHRCYQSEAIIQEASGPWELLQEKKKQAWIRTARLAIQLAK